MWLFAVQVSSLLIPCKSMCMEFINTWSQFCHPCMYPNWWRSKTNFLKKKKQIHAEHTYSSTLVISPVIGNSISSLSFESGLSHQNLDPCFKIWEGKPTWTIHLAILCKSYVASWVVHRPISMNVTTDRSDSFKFFIASTWRACLQHAIVNDEV